MVLLATAEAALTFYRYFHKQIRSSNCRNVRGGVRCRRSFSIIPTGLFLLFPPSALKKEGRRGRRKGERKTASRGGGGEIFSRPVEAGGAAVIKWADNTLAKILNVLNAFGDAHIFLEVHVYPLF